MPCCDTVSPKFAEYYSEQGRIATQLLCALGPYLHKIPAEDLDSSLMLRYIKWAAHHEMFDAMSDEEKLEYVMGDWKESVWPK